MNIWFQGFLAIVIVAALLYPSRFMVIEPFENGAKDTNGKPIVKSVRTTTRVKLAGPDEKDEYVLKSSLLPCTCPTFSCPRHNGKCASCPNDESTICSQCEKTSQYKKPYS
jgi:hypothetical protein